MPTFVQTEFLMVRELPITPVVSARRAVPEVEKVQSSQEKDFGAELKIEPAPAGSVPVTFLKVATANLLVANDKPPLKTESVTVKGISEPGPATTETSPTASVTVTLESEIAVGGDTAVCTRRKELVPEKVDDETESVAAFFKFQITGETPVMREPAMTMLPAEASNELEEVAVNPSSWSVDVPK